MKRLRDAISSEVVRRDDRVGAGRKQVFFGILLTRSGDDLQIGIQTSRAVRMT